MGYSFTTLSPGQLINHSAGIPELHNLGTTADFVPVNH